MTQYSSNDAPSKWFVDDVTGNISRSTMSADNCVSNIIETADWESEVNTGPNAIIARDVVDVDLKNRYLTLSKPAAWS